MIDATHASRTAAGARRPASLFSDSARALALLTPICLAGPADASGWHVDELKITAVGIYDSGTVPLAGSPGIPVWQRTSRLVRATTTVCPKPGTEFGLFYSVEGEPVGVPVPILVRVSFPSPGIRYPGKEKAEMYVERIYSTPIGGAQLISYAIGGDWDARPGRWTVGFWSGGRLLAEQAFELDKSACATPD